MLCETRISLLVLALVAYEEKHGHLPPPYTVDKNGKSLHSWRTLLLPHFYHNDMYSKIRFDEPWDSPHNSQFHSVPMPSFCCPSDENNRERLYTSYDVVVGENTASPPFDPETKTQPTVSIEDISNSVGTANAILLIERQQHQGAPIHWMDPTPLRVEDLDNEMAFRHNGVMLAAHADRSVRLHDQKTDAATLRKMIEWKKQK